MRELLGSEFEIISLAAIGCTDDIAETADSFEGNSLIKAKYVYENFNIDCISDDSGLEVTALNGAPGIYSARYAGEQGNSDKNMEKLLTELHGKENRSAQFRTVVTYIRKGEVFSFNGIVKGTITHSKQGEGGFGYDPIFQPEGFDITFAQMSPSQKNPISHRGKAIAALLAFIQSKK
jgi:XTP/dITP diphosphohydrolase